MALRDFLLGTDVPEETVNRRNSRESGGTRFNASNLEELVDVIVATQGCSTREEAKSAVKKHFQLRDAVPKKVYVYGSGDEDFIADKDFADMMAAPGFKVHAALVREFTTDDGKKKSVIMTRDEMKEFFRTHPGFTLD